MSTLTALGAGHGFTAGTSLETTGQIAVIPAYQNVYFADGRNPVDGGYSKLDMFQTKLVGEASGAFTNGEVINQVTSNASGVFFESVGNNHFVYRTTTTEFDATNECTGADSTETVTPTSVVAPPHWLPWVPTAGDLPEGGANVGALSFGRIFLNDLFHPNQWAASRSGDPLDWLVGQTDVRSPINSQNSKMGLVGDPITAFIPYKDRFQVVGCLNEVWVMRGDPAAGGTLTNMSKATGIFDGMSWCWDDKNNLYFLGTDGVYAISTAAIIEAGTPENITKERVPELLKNIGLNRRSDRVVMAFDKQRYGVSLTVSQKDGEWHSSWWIDLRAGGLFPEGFASDHIPASTLYFDARTAADRGRLLGCQDGYVRKYDDNEKSDDGDVAIDAWVTVGPMRLSKTPRDRVKVNEISVELSEASDGVVANVHMGKTSEELVNKITVAQAPTVKKVLSGHGLQSSIRNKVAGGAVAVKIENNTAGESFALEEIQVTIVEAGRRK